MTKFLLIMAAIALLVMLLFAWQAWQSRGQSLALGLVAGQLRPCSEKPNCVTTETGDLPPIQGNHDSIDELWQHLQTVMVEHKGRFREIHDNYYWVEFDTPIFGFRDDVEARLDKTKNVIHLRSASRVGYSDLGANHKRLARLISAMDK